ncbi:Protein dopey-1 [Galdieria sulphuraria]|nr:Protein dopey-1 [Galdieria sulphuraria]
MSSDESYEATLSDPKLKAKFRTFKTELGSILASFKRAEDWADLIRDLQRLGRLLQKFQDLPLLPHKLQVAKRLAQCLSKSLPSGVHLKALEVYDIIFSRFHLALSLRDMHLFGLGIFPLYPVASTTTRPLLLQLFEKYFVNLSEDFVVSLLQGLFASILPGMDDESGELYVRLINLLDVIRSRLSNDVLFFQIFWRTISDFRECRLNALNYLQLKAGQLSIIESCIDIVKPAIILCLEDTHILVQRAILDFLSSYIPISTVESVFKDDSVALVQKVLSCLLQRDPSITKRVLAWVLEEKDEFSSIVEEKDSTMEMKNTVELIVAALKGYLQIPSNRRDCSWDVLIIVHSLFERQQLQSRLKDKIAMELLDYGFSCLQVLHINRKSADFARLESSYSENVKTVGSSKRTLDLAKSYSSSSHEMERLFVELLSGACYTPLLSMIEELLESNVEQLPCLRWQAFSYVLELPVSKQENLTGWCIRVMQHTSKFMRECCLNCHEQFWVWKHHKAVWDFFSRSLILYLSSLDGELRRDKHFNEFNSIAVDFIHSMKIWIRETLLSQSSLSSHFSEGILCSESGQDMANFEKFLLQIGSTLRLLYSSLQSKRLCDELLKLAQQQSLSSQFTIAYCGVYQFVELFTFYRSFMDSSDSRGQASASMEEKPCDNTENESQMKSETTLEHFISPVLLYWWSLLHPSAENCCIRVAQVWFSLQKCFPVLAQRIICKQLNTRSSVERLKNLECFAMLWKLVLDYQLTSPPPSICTLDAINLLNDPDESVKAAAVNWLLDCFCYQPTSILDILTESILASNFYWDNHSNCIVNIEDAPRARYGLLQLNNVINTVSSYRYALLERDALIFTRLQSSHFIISRLSSVFLSNDVRQQMEETSQAFPLSTRSRRSRDQQQETLDRKYRKIISCFLQSDLQSNLSQRWEQQTKWDAVDLLPYIDDFCLLKYQNKEDWMITFTGSEDPFPFFSSMYNNAANVLWNLLEFIQTMPEMGRELSLNIYPSVLIALDKAVKRRDESLQRILLEILERMMFYQGASWGVPESLHFQQVHANAVSNVIASETSFPWMERHSLFQSCYLQGIRQSLSETNGNAIVLARKWIQFTEDIVHVTQYTLPFLVETFVTIVGEQLESLFTMNRNQQVEERVLERLVLLISGLYNVLKRVFQIHRQAVKDGTLPSIWTNENVTWKSPPSSDLRTFQISSQQSQSARSVLVSSLNPFRLINDLVKDVWGKESLEQAEKTIDPRQEVIRRLVLNQLDELIAWLVDSWLRPWLSLSEREDEETSRLQLLPKYFSQHRTWCIHIVDLLFRKHPVDTLAAITVFWEDRILQSSSHDGTQYRNEDESYQDDKRVSSRSNYPSAEILFELLHATDVVTPELVLSSCSELAAATVVYLSKEALGTSRNPSATSDSASYPSHSSFEDELESWILSIVPPKLDKSSLLVVRLSSFLAQGSTSTLFCSNEFFQNVSPERCMISLLSFMEWYISSCSEPGENSADLLSTWPYISYCLRDILNICSERPIVFFIALRLLAAFIVRVLYPLVDRSFQKDWTELFLYLVKNCCSIAGGSIQQRTSLNPVKSQGPYSESASQVILRAFSILSITIVPVFELISNSNSPNSLLTSSGDWETSIGLPSSQQIVNVAVQTIRRVGNRPTMTSHEMECAVEAARLLSNCCSYPWAIRVMRKEVMSLLDSNNIFKHKNEAFLREFARVICVLLVMGNTSGESVNSSSFSSKVESGPSFSERIFFETNSNHHHHHYHNSHTPPPPPQPSTGAAVAHSQLSNSSWHLLMTSFHSFASNNAIGNVLLKTRDVENTTCCRILRRISFCFYAGGSNQFIAQLPLLLERWNEASEMSSIDVHKECLFGMRVLLIRYSEPHIAMFRVWLQMELFQIFSHPNTHRSLWIAALRTIDYLLLFGMSDFIFTKNFFLSGDLQSSSHQATVEMGDNVSIPVIGNWLRRIPSWQEKAKPFEAIIDNQLRQGLPIDLQSHTEFNDDEEEDYLVAFAVAIERRATETIWQTIPVCQRAAEESVEREFLDSKA